MRDFLSTQIDRFITLDFETFYSDLYTLKHLTLSEYVRDPRFEAVGVGVKVNSNPAVWFSPEEFVAWAKCTDWSRTAVLAHHSHFDCFILSEHYGIHPRFILDTLSMARALHGTEVGGSLAFLAKHYQVGEKGHEVVNAKGLHRGDFTPEALARYGDYCKNDVELTHRIFWKMLEAGFPESELGLVDTTVKMFTEPEFVLDTPLLKRFQVEERQRKADLLAKIAADKSDLMSNEKFADLLRYFDIEPPRKISPRTKKETYAFAKTDPGMRELLESPIDEIRWLAEARVGVKSTINETRTERFLRAGEGGRPVPVYLRYYGAHTGRWSGGEKMNMQNLVRVPQELLEPLRRGEDVKGGELRRSLLAPAGKTLVVADSSQIEARVLAWLANDTNLIETFRRNDETHGDFYSDIGSQFFGKPLSKKDTPVERQLAKNMVLGLGFGMGWYKFAGELLKGMLGSNPVQFTDQDAEKYGVNVNYFETRTGNLERIEKMPSRLAIRDRIVHCAVADYFVKKYRYANPAIPSLWSDLGDALEAMEQGIELPMGPGDCLRTLRHAILLPNGLKLRYPGLAFGEDGFSYWGGRSGKERVRIYGGLVTENVVQALARIIVAEQMLKIQALGCKVAAMTHDEVVVVVPEADGEAVLEKMVEIMKQPPEWAAGLPLSAEGGFGRSYGAIK